MPHVARLGVNVIPESGAFEPEEIFVPVRRVAARLDVCRAHHDQAAGRAPGATATPPTSAPSSGAARRCMSRTRSRALDRFGPRFAQIYGQGESPMTITTLSKEDIADRDHPRWRERLARPAGPMPASRSWSPTPRTGRCRPARPARSSARGDVVMPGYWRNPDATAQTLARRLAAHRRRRRLRRRRLSDAEGPLQGRDHLRRLQHLSARGRGGAAGAQPACAKYR